MGFVNRGNVIVSNAKKVRLIDMEIAKLKLSLEEILYFGFFILLSVTKGFGLYEGQKLFMLLVVPAFICALLKLLLTPYTKRQWAMVLTILFLAAIVYYESRELGIFFLVFTILGMKKISVDKVFRLGLWVWSVCAILLSIFSFFRLEHTIYRVNNKFDLGYFIRWSLGFTHPNILHITYFALCAFILYELSDRYRFRHFLLLMLGNVLVFLYSVSYTGFGIVILLLIGELYVNARPKFSLFEKILANLVLPFILLISFILPLLFGASLFTEVMEKLNLLFNTRIRIASLFLVPEGMSLFGVRMSHLSDIYPYASIDNSYIWAFIHYGIIPFILFVLAYLILIMDYSKKQKTRDLILIICFLGTGFTEQLLFNTSFKNVTLLFLGELLFRQKEGAEEYCLFPTLHSKIENGVSLLCAKLKVSELIELLAALPSRLGSAWKTHRRQILTGIATGALLGVVLCGICYRPPKGYIVPRIYTDWLDKAFICLESADDPAYKGYRVMNYQDSETPMQIVEGRAVDIETARYYLGSILIGGFAGYLVCAGVAIRKNQEINCGSFQKGNLE